MLLEWWSPVMFQSICSRWMKLHAMHPVFAWCLHWRLTFLSSFPLISYASRCGNGSDCITYCVLLSFSVIIITVVLILDHHRLVHLLLSTSIACTELTYSWMCPCWEQHSFACNTRLPCDWTQSKHWPRGTSRAQTWPGEVWKFLGQRCGT